MMGPSALDRVQAMREAGRPKEAMAELARLIAADPTDPELHAEMSLCALKLDDGRQALASAEQAAALAPDWAYAHMLRSWSLLELDRFGPAEAAARQALELEPESPYAFVALSQALLAQGKNAQALKAADEALALDAENESALHLHSEALARLGKLDEAAAQNLKATRLDPEASHLHTQRGFQRLRVHDVPGAIDAFREALRLEPGSAYAREGLLEALRAKFWPYRILMAFGFWMQRFGTGVQWAIIIGLIVGRRALVEASEANPALRPFLLPLGIVLGVFLFLMWFLPLVLNMALLFHPVGKYAMTLGQKRVAQCMWGLVAWAPVLVIVTALVRPAGVPLAFSSLGVGAVFLGLTNFWVSDRVQRWLAPTLLVVSMLLGAGLAMVP